MFLNLFADWEHRKRPFKRRTCSIRWFRDTSEDFTAHPFTFDFRPFKLWRVEPETYNGGIADYPFRAAQHLLGRARRGVPTPFPITDIINARLRLLVKVLGPDAAHQFDPENRSRRIRWVSTVQPDKSTAVPRTIIC